MKSHQHLILGGTFDRFHAGHKLFLRTALHETSYRLTIGVTTPGLLGLKKLSETIESYNAREKNVSRFIAENKKNKHKVGIIPISDIYGTSLTDVTINGIVVTKETEKGAAIINEKRKEIGMKPLSVIRVPMVMAEDGVPISSFRIRYGDIDRNGMSYYKQLTGTQKLQLPDELRPLLREPLGVLIQGNINESSGVVKKIIASMAEISPQTVFAIGDIICQTMFTSGQSKIIGVIDKRSRRKALSADTFMKSLPGRSPKYSNRPGTIEREAVAALRNARDRFMSVKKRQLVVIDGEEDLLALPAILLAPLGSIVLYGQFDQGVVLVHVTEKEKKKVMRLIKKFTY